MSRPRNRSGKASSRIRSSGRSCNSQDAIDWGETRPPPRKKPGFLFTDLDRPGKRKGRRKRRKETDRRPLQTRPAKRHRGPRATFQLVTCQSLSVRKRQSASPNALIADAWDYRDLGDAAAPRAGITGIAPRIGEARTDNQPSLRDCERPALLSSWRIKALNSSGRAGL